MKTALKVLTRADLSLFKSHQSLSKQRAFRLDGEIFVERFYPGLRGSYDPVVFPLMVIGPGGRPAHRLTRMALRAFGGRHWYIKGESIYDPAEEPGRYDKLSENDFALVAIDGNERPRTVTLILVSVAQDAELHALLADRFEFPHTNAAREVSEAAIAHLHANTLGAYTRTHHPLAALITPKLFEENEPLEETLP